jgi:2-methylcitrate dehydratase PrpD
MGITSQIADFIANINYKDLPPVSIEQAKYCFLDWVGVTLLGTKEKASEIAASFVEKQGSNQEATIINHNLKTSTLLATLVNGISSHVLDFDDIYPWGPGHPGVTVFPAALSMAEKLSSSGIDFIKATIIGFQVQFAIGEAIMPEHYKKGWHNTSTLGRFGAVSSVSSLLGMSAEKIINALGIAATSGGGLKAVFGSMSKSFNAGKAGMDGMMSALLAHDCFDSTKDSLENKQGFLRLFSSNNIVNEEKAIEALLGPFVIERVRPKQYPSCYSTHSVIECMLSIHKQLDSTLKATDIKSITCFVHPRCLEIAAITDPKTPLECRFSTQFCGAVALKKGNIGIEDFILENIKDLEITKLMQKMNLIAREEYEKNRKAEVIIELKDGRELKSSVDLAELTEDRVKSNNKIIDKINCNLQHIRSRDSIEKIKDIIINMENVNNIRSEVIPYI